MLKFLVLSTALFSSLGFAQEREIAITIDDLPLVASRMNTPGNQKRATDRFTTIVDTLKNIRFPLLVLLLQVL